MWKHVNLNFTSVWKFKNFLFVIYLSSSKYARIFEIQGPETRQVCLVSTTEHMQGSNGTDQVHLYLKEWSSSIDLTHPLLMFYGHLSELCKKVKFGNEVYFSKNVMI